MYIKTKKRNKVTTRRTKKNAIKTKENLPSLSPKKRIKRFLKITLFLLAFIFLWNIENILQSKRYIEKTFYNEQGDGHATISRNEAIKDLIKYTINYKLFSEPLPTIKIDIKQQDFSEISHTRKKILDREERTQEYVNILKKEKKWYPAHIKIGNKKRLKAKLRIKGDLLDHIKHKNKWSFKVKLKGKSHILGMNKFSIQHPVTRNWLGEVFLSELMRKNDILAPKMLFANIYINGEKIGIMNIESDIEKEFLESQKRKDSAVLRIDESSHWQQWRIKSELAKNLKGQGIEKSQLDKYFRIYYKNIPIEAMDDKKTKLNKTAISLLRGHLNGKIKWQHVFDKEKMATYLAILQLLNNDKYYHGLEHTNTRFYYNPIIGKIEPISNDNMASLHKLKIKPISYPEYRYVELFSNDPKFKEAFLRKSYQITKDIAYSNKYDDIYKLIDYYYSTLKTEFLYIAKPLDIETFKKRAVYINNLRAKELNITSNHNNDNKEIVIKKIQNQNKPKQNTSSVKKTYIVKRNNQVQDSESTLKKQIYNRMNRILDVYDITDKRYLEINPIIYEDIIITSAVVEDLDSDNKEHLKTYKKFPIKIKKYHDCNQNSTIIRYKQPSFKNYKIKIKTKLTNLSKSYVDKAIRNYPSPLTRPKIPTSTPKRELKKHHFLKKSGNSLIIKSGKWNATRNIIIPKGYELVIEPGTNISFAKNTAIISYGAIRAISSKSNPIILGSISNYWKGIMVIKANKTSNFENVKIFNLSGVNYRDWSVTGSVTFYESDVKMKNVTINNNVAEDALNIVHSEFLLDEITINNTVSDAFDSDFSKGTIINGFFKDIGSKGGGDAIDFSGSIVNVEGGNFINVKDKAVSVGEGSSLTVNKVHIKNSGYAFAAKDGSTLKINSSTLDNMIYCDVMTYNKKNEYGPSKITAKNLKSLSNKKICAKAQKGNKAKINGKKIKEEKFDIDKLYKTTMKKNKS